MNLMEVALSGCRKDTYEYFKNIKPGDKLRISKNRMIEANKSNADMRCGYNGDMIDLVKNTNISDTIIPFVEGVFNRSGVVKFYGWSWSLDMMEYAFTNELKLI